MKPSTYNINEWCEYKKHKTMVIMETNKLVPKKQLVNIDEDMIWEKWKAFKLEYNMNEAPKEPW